MKKGRPPGDEKLRFLSVGLQLSLRVHSGGRLKYRAICEEYNVSPRTAMRWIDAIGRVLPLVKETDGDGCASFYVPRDMRNNFLRGA